MGNDHFHLQHSSPHSGHFAAFANGQSSVTARAVIALWCGRAPEACQNQRKICASLQIAAYLSPMNISKEKRKLAKVKTGPNKGSHRIRTACILSPTLLHASTCCTIVVAGDDTIYDGSCHGMGDRGTARDRTVLLHLHTGMLRRIKYKL